ncbi:MAG: hypothetical protein EU533_00730 [Promethearchaeota archaeon]|nr:MAG: hypothetical protein EU533_00730 [Candidatus Lokiarchaeota archaeon]
MVNVNYPSENIYDPSGKENANYDHVILWMLYNNEVCKWGDFSKEPIEIPLGTLSRHMDQLKRKGFVEKISRGSYKITLEGKKKFYEQLTGKGKERKLNYPPEIVLNTRNYDHWILWMLYNNNYCKRSHFLENPLNINQSSLSKTLNLLIKKRFIIKNEGKYIITTLGKSRYSKILKNYDLDRQTILEEETKRIEEINKNTTNLFNLYKVKDKEVQFNFLNYILKLDYERVKSLLKDEELFYKIILFFAMNHPNQYPRFISSKVFSDLYRIKTTTLDYYVEEISEGKIYPTKFFKLKGPSGGNYYFQSDGKLEKMLGIISETQINKHAYLNKLFSNTASKTPNIDINLIITSIIDESCECLFHQDFKESLSNFIPEFINYLSYKIEIKKELKDTYDKLEGIIWQELLIAFDSQINVNLKSQYEEEIDDIDKEIALDPHNLDLYKSKIRILIYFNQYNEILKILDIMLEKFPEEEIDLMMKKASIYRKKKDLNVGLEIIEGLIKKYPENNELLSFKAFWLQYMNRRDESLELIETLIKKEPNKGIFYDNYGEILMYFEEYEEATKKFLKVLLKGNEWYYYQTYIKLGICYKVLNKLDLAQNNLKKGIELIKTEDSNHSEIKEKWLAIANLFLAEIQSNK